MKITTNTKLIEQRAKWAKRFAPVTMLLLMAGLGTNFMSMSQPQYLQPTIVLLALGFISAMFSSHMVNTWVREPRADQVLESVLKKMGSDYHLFNYTTPVAHVLLAPDGLYTFVVKSHGGEISVNGSKFSRKFSWWRVLRLFADEGLGAPIAEVESRANKLNKFLAQKLGAEAAPVIKPVVLFSNKEAQLTVDNAPLPVLLTNQLKDLLREEGKSRAISSEQRRQLTQILAG